MTRAKKTTSSTEVALERVSAYAQDVLNGAIVAGPHVRNACRRHFADLEVGFERGLSWDDEAANRVFRFFEERLKLSEGQFDGKPFLLHPSQAFKLGSIFGWKKADGTRRFRTVYIEEGKGNGKSPFAGGVGLYGLTADKESGAQIYAAAAKKDQAQILFQDACKMVRQAPALKERVKFSGGLGKEFNIAHHKSGSFFRPISKEAGKTGSGPRPHFALCDEVHEHPDRSIMEMLQRGFKFRQNPLLLMITNSGSDRNSVCWEERDRAVKVLAGTQTPDEDFTFIGETWEGSDSVFAYVCSLDKHDDPMTDPSCWIKANPLLGTILTEEYLAGVVAEARAVPGKLNNVLRLHFCVWTDADKAWMARATVDGVMSDWPLPEGGPIFLGIDLSGTKDMTVVACVQPTGFREITRDDGVAVSLPTYDAWIEAWTPGDTLAARVMADKQPYDIWVRDGYLNAPEGPRIRLDIVAARIAELDRLYDIQSIAYDNYAYAAFKDELAVFGVDAEQLPHPQGGKVRARPSEEKIEAAKAAGEKPPLGLWMPGSVTEVENLIIDGRIRLRKSPVLMTALMGATFNHPPDPHGNRWFVKTRASVRIDSAVAIAMACGAAADKPAAKAPVSPWDDPDFSLASAA
ncbi:terminase large subunit [Mesorhizobium sp. B2-5-7]|uniref:terminase large subunit n=1 Tax=Mesorhizobium sp. B2-5-7 TaxID=2589923 RepID=UPI00112B198D|nr:terminase large subunit [Mesorhizobium sp. B2-5-7]TPK18072.1 terminase large subunit [Mesorhizobium sp. B2-5-7]